MHLTGKVINLMGYYQTTKKNELYVHSTWIFSAFTITSVCAAEQNLTMNTVWDMAAPQTEASR